MLSFCISLWDRANKKDPTKIIDHLNGRWDQTDSPSPPPLPHPPPSPMTSGHKNLKKPPKECCAWNQVKCLYSSCLDVFGLQVGLLFPQYVLSIALSPIFRCGILTLRCCIRNYLNLTTNTIQNGVLMVIWAKLVADIPYGRYNYEYITKLRKYLLGSILYQAIIIIVGDCVKSLWENGVGCWMCTPFR